MKGPRDHDLGMDRKITRRDFLNGVALTAGALLIPPHLMAWMGDEGFEPERNPSYYPPALTGLRGSHIGSFEAAHQLRDGDFWEKAGKPEDTGETYDLVIVGGGISGLAAAHFFRQINGPRSRILIIENHDDFGGHAKRNEFQAGARSLLGYGGTFSIESPAPYSAASKGLIEKLGIDVGSYRKLVENNVYLSRKLAPHIFFDRETFGADRLVVNPSPVVGSEEADLTVEDKRAWDDFMAQAPLSQAARDDFKRLHLEKKDYLPGPTSTEKKWKLAQMSYARFLSELVKVSPEVVKVYQTAPHPLFGVGIDAVAAQDAWGLGLPGFKGMGLDPEPGKGMNRDCIPNEEADRYFFHFPDGNASIARLLVRSVIPAAIPGSTAADVVTARADYARLDEPSSPVRIRLNSIAVRVKHAGPPTRAKEVQVAYARGGKVYTVRGAHCILACWHQMIPLLNDELSEEQRKALLSAEKVPLLYTNVALNNWQSWAKASSLSAYSPGSYHENVNLDLPVNIGEYRCSQDPDQPIVVHMSKTPCKPGLPARLQHRAGRGELFTTTFETMERNIRDQLARTLGPFGFDPARDIAAITVNRWPHGYAYEYNSLWDDFWLHGTVTPCEIARRPFGRIAIANADAGAYAYTDCAIDQAYRAVQEITTRTAKGAHAS